MSARDRIVWFDPNNGLSEGLRAKLDVYLSKARVSTNAIWHTAVQLKLGRCLVPKGKNKFVLDLAQRDRVLAEVDRVIDRMKPKLIVVNCQAVLSAILGNYNSLNLCRGSVYHYRDVPCLVIDNIMNSIALRYGGWVLSNDLGKLRRWATGTQKKEPKFAYTVCHDLRDLRAATEFLCSADFIGTDIETVGQTITCSGYTGVLRDGTVHTYVVPFVNSLKSDGSHWETEHEEIEAWRAIRAIHSSPAIKIMQNGATYDAAFFLRHRVPLRNFLVDTQHIFHSIWTEAPKKLNFITSITNDYNRYWKDEVKGEKDSGYPNTPDRQARYWRYNALDCHNMVVAAFELFRVLAKNEWARRNYAVEFGLQAGPCLAAMMTGMYVEPARQTKLALKLLNDAECAHAELLTMVGDPEFNPNSPTQFAELLYDVLRATPIKMKGKNAGKNDRGTGEPVLKLLQQQHPLLRRIIGQVWKTKKPKNNYAKYGVMRLMNSRFLYTLGMAQTETGRAGSHRHPFKCGQNAQNVPNGIRHIVRADDGYFLFEPDFGASDARFVAYESGDERMIENLESDRDTHCIHAAHFFKKPYEEIYAGYKEKADWVVDSLRGVRQNAKRVGHGSNYQMSEFTLYVTMGKEAVVAAGEALQARYVVVERSGPIRSRMRYLHIPAIHGSEYRGKLLEEPTQPAVWSQRELVQLCGFMLEDYHKLYTGLRPWFRRTIEEAVKNHNLVTCAFGRTRLFFGDIRKDNKIQRELSAYYGQGGTAGNINRCFAKLYYERELIYDHGAMVLSQTHDSMLFLVPESKLHIVPPRILTVMEEPFTIRGRTLRIPADGKIGYTWGEKNMLSYSPELTLDALRAKEVEVRSKFS